MVAVILGEALKVAAARCEDDFVGGDLPVMVRVADENAILRPDPGGADLAVTVVEDDSGVGAEETDMAVAVEVDADRWGDCGDINRVRGAAIDRVGDRLWPDPCVNAANRDPIRASSEAVEVDLQEAGRCHA